MHDQHPSSDNLSTLIAGYLDGTLRAGEEAWLDRLVATDHAVAVRVARAALLHDRLHDLFRAESCTMDEEGATHGAEEERGVSWRRRWAVASVAVTLVLALCVIPRASSSTAAASAALDRIVAAAETPADRTYLITVLDHGNAGPPPPVVSADRGRKPGVDGARLHVRGADRFVLVRRFDDGAEFITGSDGSIGWAVPPRGKVHLSHDPRRFRRGLPGEREEVPFVDVRSSLDGLRRGYDLALTSDGDGGARLDAVRRPGRRRGPERVLIACDAAGVPTRILIEGQPVEEGMPCVVELTLVSREDLGAGYFSHDAHHDADRPLDWE